MKEIKLLREKADRLRSKKSIVTRLSDAVAIKAWADDLRAQMPAASTAADSAPRLRELWRCASQPAKRTIDHRMRRHSPTDVVAANKQPLSEREGATAAASHELRGNGSRDAGTQPTLLQDDPFASIDDKEYERLRENHEKSKRAGFAVGDAPLNPEQRDGGRSFLQMARLRRAALRRGQSINSLRQSIEQDGITLVVGAGGTGKSAMVHRLREQFAAHDCGKLLVTAYTGVAVRITDRNGNSAEPSARVLAS